MISKAAFFILAVGALVLWVLCRFADRTSKKRRAIEEGGSSELFAIVSGLIAGITGFAAVPEEPVFVGIGVVLLLLASLSEVLHRRAASRERRQLGCCPACVYDLTGNVSGRCPECGNEIE